MNCGTRLLLGFVRVYQLFLSPFLGPSCRYVPSCSDYALEVLRHHGAIRGSIYVIRRLLRCHPWGGSGYDPPPDRCGKSHDQCRHS